MHLAFSSQFSRRAAVGVLAGTLTVSAAGAATFHRLAVSSATGSGGAAAFVQGIASGGALQGEVASSPQTAIKIPFGVLGEYNAAGSTFGIGVIGISTTGYAVGAEALGNQPSMLAYSAGNNEAFEAAVSSGHGADAVTAVADSGTAVDATSTSGIAVFANGGGEQTIFSINSSSQTTEGYGTFGDAAVDGDSTHGPGVYGANEDEASANPFAGGGGIDAGVSGYSNDGPGIFADSNSSSGATIRNDSAYPTLLVNADLNESSNYEIAAASGNLLTDNFNFYVNSVGDMYAQGSVTSGTDSFEAVSRNPNARLTTYSAQQAEATVEDLGSARVIDGTATVSLAADFQKTIDASRPYMVFLTPYGDSDGLYIASRTAAGFVVREHAGGHSTLAFDYRIVARPYGARHARLPAFVTHANPHGADRGREIVPGAASPRTSVAWQRAIAKRAQGLEAAQNAASAFGIARGGNAVPARAYAR